MNGFRIEDDAFFVGDRSFPTEKITVEDLDAGSSTFHSRHAWVRFENGWMLSFTWGTGTYSTNHDSGLDGEPFMDEPPTCEVWGWWGTRDASPPTMGIPPAPEDPMGWVSVDDALKLIDEAQWWPSP